MIRKLFVFMLAFSLLLNLAHEASVFAEQEATFENPVIWADVPDLDAIRVDDAYYMTSTTMHMNPGVPIMKSYDLVHWEIVNYVYDILADNDEQSLRNGKSDYGKGSWASSLRYHDGKYYVVFASYSTGKTYIYQTTNIEKGPWTRSVLDGVYHDMSLLFDDDESVYLVYGSGDIRIIELTGDATAIKEGGLNKILIPEASLVASSEENVGLPAEGSHIQKINGYYYVFNIAWPKDSPRVELVHRSSTIDGTYEGKVVLKEGTAQGGIIDTKDGKWYGMLFQDHGSVGRIPYLVPVTWDKDWPVFGINGKVPDSMQIPVSGVSTDSKVVGSDEFYQGTERIGASHYNDLQDSSAALATVQQAANLTVEAANTTTESQYAAASAVQSTVAGEEGKEILLNGGFEDGQEPWTAHDDAVVTVSEEVYSSGAKSLLVTGRQATGAGVEQSVAGAVKAGGTYTFSAKVRYDGDETVPAARQFNFSIQDGDWTTIKIMGSATVNKGEWGLIEGTYTIPEDAILSEPRIFIETSWTSEQDPVKDLMDFYVDDVVLEDITPDLNLLTNGGFENGETPWTVHESGVISVTSDESYSGSYSLHFTGRKTTGSGPQQFITGKVQAGHVYKISARVKYIGDNSLPSSKQFNIDYQDGDWQTIKVMGSATVNKGEWGKIDATYTVPEDALLQQPLIFIETVWTSEQDPVKDLMDFYVDDVVLEDVTPSGGLDKTASGEYDYNGSNLALMWQWNHNPDNNHWSLTERPGYLRLTTGRKSTSLEDARNTLTQRTFGPESSGSVAVEVSQMKNGDIAGLAAFQKDYGYVGVKMEGNTKSIVMINASTGTANEIASVPLVQDRVYFKVELDFKNMTDKAYFYYSLDGVQWQKLGNTLQMSYKLDHFMGYRFALFNYATKSTGGYVDFDYFRVTDKMTGTEPSGVLLRTELGDVTNVLGVQNMELEVPVKMEALPDGEYTSISSSYNIPHNLSVTGVEFNTGNITGTTSYTYDNHRLQLHVSGEKVNYTNASTDLFATITFKVEGFVPADLTTEIRTDYIQVTGGNVIYNVNDAVSEIELKQLSTTALAKIPGYSNPLVSHKLGADPYALVYNGRVYIYMSSDAFEYDSSGKIKDNSFANLNKVNVISSADMVNWTDHGSIPVAGAGGIAEWAYFSWAPAAAHKTINGEDKFFLYFANGAGGIGVLTADSPLGPWTDPLGKALVSGDTPGVPGVVWLFDPAVLVDDNGTGYLYFGGGIPGDPNPTAEQIAHPKTARVIELGDDMISTVHSAVEIDAPYMFEDSGIHKYNGKYYYSYCSNFAGTHPDGTPPAGEIAYMMSDNPMGPFTYVAPILKNPYEFFGVGGNNHHAIFEFNGQWYVTYHAQTVSKAAIGDGKGYRSTHINKVEFYENGLIKDIKGDMEGIAQLQSLNPYARTEAETIAWNAGIATEATEAAGSPLASLNLDVTDIQNGDWLAVADADFGSGGAETFAAHVASSTGGQIELRLDSPLGAVIGTLEVTPTGGEQTWKLFKTSVSHVKGIHNVFFMFQGEDGQNLFNLDYWQFTPLVTEEIIPLQSVSIAGGAESVKVSGQLDFNAAITPADATLPAYHWEAGGNISITGADNMPEVTIKGVTAGKGTLTLTVSAGETEKQAVKVITVTSDDGGSTSTPTPTATPTPTPKPTVTTKPVSTSAAATPTPSNAPVASSATDVLLNGQPVNAGMIQTTVQNGNPVTTVILDQLKLEQFLDTGREGGIIRIEAVTDSGTVIGQLNGQLLQILQDKKAVIEITTGRASYTVPAQQIDLSALLGQLGVSLSPQDITIQLELAGATQEKVKLLEDAADQEQFTLLVQPVDFTIKGSYKESTVTVTRFKDYVDREIALPEGVTPEQVTTGIVLESDGTVSHVPTIVVNHSGKYYAKLSSLTNSTYSVIYHSVTFLDAANHWAKSAIHDMGSRLVIRGIGNDLFSPDAAVTRAEFAAILVRGLGLSQVSGASPYADVPGTAWYSGAVMTAKAYGLIAGFEDGTFRPDSSITREQAMTILAKALALTGLKAQLPVQTANELLSPYADADDISYWAASGIADSIQAGIVSGRSISTLAPKALVTRAEVAVMVQKLLKQSRLI